MIAAPRGPVAPPVSMGDRGDDLRRVADVVGFGCVVAAILIAGVLQGRVVVTLPDALASLGAVAVLNAELACYGFVATLLVSAGVLVADAAAHRERGPLPTGGPEVAAIVPIYGDPAVLGRSVESLLASEYDDLTVYVVCEPGDAATLAAAAEYAERDRVVRLVNDRNPGSKAAAVDYAVSVTQSDLVGVFDADERVHPRFVPAAVAGLREHDVFQGRTLPRTDGALESVAYYESVVLGYLSQRLLVALTDFRTVTSNVVVMRRAAFDRVGGYDPGMLTEDFDFAFRCYEAGVEVRETLAYPSEIEAAHTVTDWWGQRKRWMTGYAQVFHRRIVHLRPLESPRSALAVVVSGGALLGNAFLLSLVAQLAVLVAAGATTALAAYVLALWGVSLAVRLLDARAGNVDGVGVGWLLVPVAIPLYSLAAIKGVVEYPTSWEGEWYRVSKGG